LPRPDEIAGDSLAVKEGAETPEPVQLPFVLVPPEEEEVNLTATKASSDDVGYAGVRLLLKLFDDEVRHHSPVTPG
jgi:hypothetical protein